MEGYRADVGKVGFKEGGLLEGKGGQFRWGFGGGFAGPGGGFLGSGDNNGKAAT